MINEVWITIYLGAIHRYRYDCSSYDWRTRLGSVISVNENWYKGLLS